MGILICNSGAPLIQYAKDAFPIAKRNCEGQSEIVKAFRSVLKEPKLVGLVILDLARLKDWNHIETLVTLANNSTEGYRCRLPVVNFRRICPPEKAKKELTNFRGLDSKVFRRASDFFADAMIASVEWK